MPGSTGGRLFITNLSLEVGWKQLKDHCWNVGVTACHVDVVHDPKSGQPTGQALVDLDDNTGTALDCGIRLTGTILAGRPMFACPFRLGYLFRRTDVPTTGDRGFNCGDSFADWGASNNDRQQPQAAGTPWHNARKERSRSGGSHGESKRGEPLGVRRSRSPCARAVPPHHWVPPPPKPSRNMLPSTPHRLFVEGLAPTVTWQALKDHALSQLYDVAFADVTHSKDKPSFRVIEFTTHDNAREACMKLNGSMLHKQPIRLRLDRSEFSRIRREYARQECAEMVPPSLSLPAGWGASRDDAGADKEEVGTPSVTG